MLKCLVGILAGVVCLAGLAWAESAAIVRVSIETRAEVDALSAAGFNVTDVRPGEAVIYAYGGDIDRLLALGYTPEMLGRDGQPPVRSKVDDPGPDSLGQYHDHEAVTGFLAYYADAYPELTRLENLGESAQGREIWAMLITESPELKQDKPAFKYIATMHGDEPVGTEMCLYFIDHLLSNYGDDDRITALVDETALWIAPLMNPDGLERATRANANGVDLNRDFPVYASDFTGTVFDTEDLLTDGRQPETQVIMEWSAQHRFVLAANFHTGALVVNYPYDYEPGVPSGAAAPTPDDELLQVLSLRYSVHNEPMWNSTRFPQGITNGSRWFSIQGGMQDWNYRFMGGIETTIELWDVKWPAESLLPAFWEDNREAMLAYAEQVHIGVRGVVTDERTGEPIEAEILVEGNSQPVFSDPDAGNYHRLLLPGVYNLAARAPLYAPRFINGVEVGEGAAARRDAELMIADLNGDGAVDALDIQLIINSVLGLPCPSGVICDPRGAGAPSAIEIQRIINAVLGL